MTEKKDLLPTDASIEAARNNVHEEEITITLRVPVIGEHGAAGTLLTFAKAAMGNYQVVTADQWAHRDRSLHMKTAAALAAAASEQMPTQHVKL